MVVLSEVKFCHKNVVNFPLRKLISIEYAQLRSPAHPTRGVPMAVSSLATLLRIPRVRIMFIKAEGTKLLAPLITPLTNQQSIQVNFCHILPQFF